jgi:glycosyltransferase involved in cell wall biosynthesis
VIASQAGALAEPIEHAVNGLVVQPGSVEELRVALATTTGLRFSVICT